MLFCRFKIVNILKWEHGLHPVTSVASLYQNAVYMRKNFKTPDLLDFLLAVHKIGLKGTNRIWPMHFVAAIFYFSNFKSFPL